MGLDDWNFDMSAAPRDEPIIAASKCGKTIKCEWIEQRGTWSGFATNGAQPVAWVAWPKHPFAIIGDLSRVA